MVRVAGALQQSAKVMTIVSDLMKVPQLQQTMMEMSKGVAPCFSSHRDALTTLIT